MRNRVTTSLTSLGTPSARASAEVANLFQPRAGTGSIASIPHFFRLDFAYATRTVLYVMAGIMAVAAIVALAGLRGGVQQEAVAVAAATDQEISRSPDVAGTD